LKVQIISDHLIEDVEKMIILVIKNIKLLPGLIKFFPEQKMEEKLNI